MNNIEKERLATLMKSWIFADYTDSKTIEALQERASLLSYGKDETIVKKDSTGKIFWILSAGKARVAIKGKKGEEIILAHMESGDFFGEISLIYQIPRTVNVIADEESELFMIDSEDFESCLLSNEPLAEKLREYARKRLEFSEEKLSGKEQKPLMQRLRDFFKKKEPKG
jgi:CRP/FNR family transcriptional regulator, cyclic AMP receptor protein